MSDVHLAFFWLGRFAGDFYGTLCTSKGWDARPSFCLRWLWHREPCRNGNAPCVEATQLRSSSRCKQADRPLSRHVATIPDYKALVDDPAAFTEEMHSHRVIVQIIKPARTSDAPSSNSDLFFMNLFSCRILPRCCQALVGCNSMNATLSDGTIRTCQFFRPTPSWL